MAERARELGVPPAALVLERDSRTTADNARRCRAALPGCRAVLLVTQPFHGRRARRCFREVGFEARVWPIVGGLEDREPARAARWIARAYAAWLIAWVRRPHACARRPGGGNSVRG